VGGDADREGPGRQRHGRVGVWDLGERGEAAAEGDLLGIWGGGRGVVC
jgi:hypothetical protein